ncbi:MAG TPA: hypothetical protein VG125_07925 [Pirellulales bacterium]|jgi:hypothetical protein|nr:hypothetical protein [Pirellulales bacterium]
MTNDEAIRLRGAGRGNLLAANTLDRGTDGEVMKDERFEVKMLHDAIPAQPQR